MILFAATSTVVQSSSEHDPYAYNRFSPSMAIIIVVLITALFFMGFFSIYIRNCSDDQADAELSAATGAVGRLRNMVRGLDEAVIATFSTLEYSVVRA